MVKAFSSSLLFGISHSVDGLDTMGVVFQFGALASCELHRCMAPSASMKEAFNLLQGYYRKGCVLEAMKRFEDVRWRSQYSCFVEATTVMPC